MFGHRPICEVITTIARECLFWPIFAPQFLLDLSVFPFFSVIGLFRLFHLLITTLIVYFWLTYIDIHLHFTFTLPIFIWSIGEIIPFLFYIYYFLSFLTGPSLPLARIWSTPSCSCLLLGPICLWFWTWSHFAPPDIPFHGLDFFSLITFAQYSLAELFSRNPTYLLIFTQHACPTNQSPSRCLAGPTTLALGVNSPRSSVWERNPPVPIASLSTRRNIVSIPRGTAKS